MSDEGTKSISGCSSRAYGVSVEATSSEATTSPDATERGKAILRDRCDAIGGVDLLTVPTVTLWELCVFFVIDHARRTTRHVNVTAHPSAEWAIQQRREAFPCDEALRNLVLDRDSTFRGHVRATLKEMATTPKLNGYRSPPCRRRHTMEKWRGGNRRGIRMPEFGSRMPR